MKNNWNDLSLRKISNVTNPEIQSKFKNSKLKKFHDTLQVN